MSVIDILWGLSGSKQALEGQLKRIQDNYKQLKEKNK